MRVTHPYKTISATLNVISGVLTNSAYLYTGLYRLRRNLGNSMEVEKIVALSCALTAGVSLDIVLIAI